MPYEINPGPAPEAILDRQQLQVIESFNNDLRSDLQIPDDEQGSNVLTHRLQNIWNTLNGFESQGQNVDGLRLIIAGEAAGASSRNLEVGEAISHIDASPLLDEKDKASLVQTVSIIQGMRMSGAPKEEVISRTSQQIEAELQRANDLQSRGVDSGNLKVAILALATGATYRSPELQYKERLMVTLQGRVS